MHVQQFMSFLMVQFLKLSKYIIIASLSKPKPRGLTSKNPAELVKNRIFSLCLQYRLILLFKSKIQRIVLLKPINTEHQPAQEELYILNTQKASTLLITIWNFVNWLTFPFYDLYSTI